ncbi:hypothetical protein NKJ36_29325 [Mesorhizobium sp. M0142]|uniref:sarcosine oxidase subunit gamma n=1 Tax=Mesorhizobium sp. M0142 TaxID=2956894 RepID=UPI003338F74A
MVRKYALPVNGTTSDHRAVTINEVELGYLTQLAGWEGFDRKADDALRAEGLSLPGDYRSSVRRGRTIVWRIAPDRALIRSNTPLGLESVIDLAVLDLSDARVCLTLEGPGARGLFNRVTAIDLADAAFPVGHFAQTAIHHVSVLIDRHDRDQFTVLIPTTFAMSLASFLADHLTAEVATKPANR